MIIMEEIKIKTKELKKNENLSFSKIEILFMIVLVALLMAAGIIVFSMATSSQNERNLKRDATQLAALALNEYSYQSMHGDSKNIVVGSDGSTKGMCITVDALDTYDSYRNLNGYFVIEETSNRQIKVSVWVTDKKLVIEGYTSDMISNLNAKNGLLKYNNEDYTKRVESSFTGAEKSNGGLNPTPNRYEAACMTQKSE